MKRGFTMIELVFVIVILGIISSIAVPKLAATREDAKVVALKANIKTVFKDLESYYAVNGDFGWGGGSYGWVDLRKISNVNFDSKDNFYHYLHIQNKPCIGIGARTSILNMIVPTDATQICIKTLEELRPLFNGYFYGYLDRPGNALDKKGTYVQRKFDEE